MKYLNLLIKPASSLCNMSCGYCFYHSQAQERSVYSYGIMRSSVMKRLLRRAFEAAEARATFAFQGGEPTLAGLDFFRLFVDLAEKYNLRGIPVGYAIQTNGLAIDDEWAAFLAEHRFLVGLSLDGDKPIHDEMRKDPSGEGSFDRVMGAVDLLRKHAVEFNILCVVRDDTARRAKELYAFFREQKLYDLQFIPCLDGAESGTASLSPEAYADFLRQTFDAYYADSQTGPPTRIRYFDNLVAMSLGLPPESCGLAGVCGMYFVAEADGGIYPCDFYTGDEWRLGSVETHSFEAMRASPRFRAFVEKMGRLPEACGGCRYVTLCRGGCMRDREASSAGGAGENQYCGTFRDFLDREGGRIFKMAERIARGKESEA
jgi:uncharacterized protein